MRRAVRLTILVFCLAVGGISPALGGAQPLSKVTIQARPFYRTELYFGRSIPSGGTVSDDEWEKFLLDVVTDRFPSGFTVLDARGQYKQVNNEVIKEPTKILIFFYPPSARASSRRKVEEIRRAYVKQFKQESVLRLDFPGIVEVRF